MKSTKRPDYLKKDKNNECWCVLVDGYDSQDKTYTFKTENLAISFVESVRSAGGFCSNPLKK